jgi:hypothetical protein
VKNSNRNNNYYTNKYDKYTNEKLCPCCFQENETVHYLFFECKYTKLVEIREKIETQVHKTVNKHVEEVKLSTKFIGKYAPNNKPNWDNYLTNLSLIPNKTVSELKSKLNTEQLPKLK